MKKNFKKISMALITAMLIITSLSLVLAENDRPIIDEYQKENTYIFALEKDVDTTINGDLFLITAESDIQGTINKDLNAISNKIRVQGIVGDDSRIIAGEANINAYVFGELKVIADRLITSNTTIINGKTSIRATNAEIKGTYHDEVRIQANKVEIDALIKADTSINSKNIKISPETRIQGSLEVPKGTKVPNNTVTGEITYKEIKPETLSTRELLVNKITLFLIITILSAFLVLIARKRTNKLVETTTKKPLLSLLIGILAGIILPIISLILLISIITAPIGALLLMTLIALLIITPALAVLMVGKQTLEMIRPRREIRLEIIIGALIIVVLSFIPGFLTLAIFLLYAFFLGTIIRMLMPKKKRVKKKDTTIKTVKKKKTKKKKK